MSGDYYYAYVYDNGSQGLYVGLSHTEASETGGSWYFYVYDMTTTGYDASLAGNVYAYYYYDGETGQTDVPYHYGLGHASGTDGAGSEFDYVDFGDGVYDYFGEGYYEADA